LLEKTAYLLVYHGSRDSRPHAEMGRLAQAVQQKLGEKSVASREGTEVMAVLTKGDWHAASHSRVAMTEPSPPRVYTAALELASLSLESAIALLVQEHGLTDLQVIPSFLLPGVHVREDIPEAVKKAQQEAGNKVKISLCPYIGQSPLMMEKLQNSFSDSENSAKIIISHGSRRVGGNEPIENLAQDLGGSAAYWSVSPSLREQVERFVKAGVDKVEILPYFLFPGGITDAIAQQVQSLETEFPRVQFHLGCPLCHCVSLADVIIHEITV